MQSASKDFNILLCHLGVKGFLAKANFLTGFQKIVDYSINYCNRVLS